MGTVHCFLKVQSYHKNWIVENFQFLFVDTCLYALSNKIIKSRASRKMTSQKIRQYLTFNIPNSYAKVTISHKIVNKNLNNLKNMAVIQPRPTPILYQCANFGDDRTSFNVIFTYAYTHISIFLASKLCPMLKYSDIYLWEPIVIVICQCTPDKNITCVSDVMPRQ